MQLLNKYLLLFCVATLPLLAFAQNGKYSMLSKHTGDKYIITIKNHNPAIQQHAVFVADGSLKMGQYMLGTDADWKAKLPANCVIITIAHTGDWHVKRRRDFIPSDAGGYKDDEFGKSQQFYLFLKDELMPLIDKKILRPLDKSFVGHSFSGLFSLYASLQPVKLFDNYYAISPSIWANYYELGKIEEQYSRSQHALKGKIFLYAGSLEVFNKVLSSTTDYYATLNTRKYAGLSVSFKEIKSANHFSIIKPALDNILTAITK